MAGGWWLVAGGGSGGRLLVGLVCCWPVAWCGEGCSDWCAGSVKQPGRMFGRAGWLLGVAGGQIRSGVGVFMVRRRRPAVRRCGFHGQPLGHIVQV